MISSHPDWAFKAFVTASHKFYRHLLEPFMRDADKVKRLTVVPDGMLNYIPFEVLISEVPQESDSINVLYSDLPFLIKKYQINYNYSSTLLIKDQLKSKQANNGYCLGFAPSAQIVHNMDSLPWAQVELEAIGKIFEGEYYYGNEAGKAEFIEKSSSFSIIHLAMHGHVNMRHPMRSQLLFSLPRDSTNPEAAALFAYEIHNLTLNADLVVLSACETGIGKSERGEGVLSLARAFMYAGAPSVLTTLWKVNDFTSAALIELFYINLSAGMSKPQALQKAKLTFLSRTDLVSGHPAYWGSFISIGSPEPITVSYSLWVYALITLSGTTFLFFLSKLLKKHKATRKSLSE
jgi:CHAT domain-containing protein